MEVKWPHASMVCAVMVFRGIIPEVLLPGVVFNIEQFLCLMAQQPKISHVHCTRTLSFDCVRANAHRRAVIAMYGGGWLGMADFLQGESRIIFASIALRKRAPSSASAADAATHLRMVQLVRMAPLRRMGHPSFGREPRKKWPEARLRAFGAVR